MDARSIALTTATGLATMAGASIAAWRWLRVSQREHYHPGRATSTASQWAKNQPEAMAPLAIGAAIWGASFATKPWAPALAVAAAGLGAVAPRPLVIRKTDQKLAWTNRAKRLAGATGVLGAGLLLADPKGRWLALGALAAPLVVDAAAAIMKPVEKQMAMKFVHQASEKLAQIDPDVVAITGSYGKTTTKNYVAHFLADVRRATPTPSSFNNLLGITRAVNDHLQPGTDVFVAEMGTYGPGEIRELCKYFPPTLAVIVSIGEAHLERMGSRETIVVAKSEILENAKVWILNVDVPELAEKADNAPADVAVIRCSAESAAGADVAVIAGEGDQVDILVEGKKVADFSPDATVHRINVAIAVAVARFYEAPSASISKQAQNLPVVASRGVSASTEHGVTIIDDTFNSNPTGAHEALASALEQTPENRTLWVVSPGMFELGSAMYERNRSWAETAFADDRVKFVSVGGTNRKAFADASAAHQAESRLEWFSTRPEAVKYVMTQTVAGDVVLYENDRPDHLP